ncbi:hypothetical protein N7457_004052 [Penicillium paradoxum]|uniref:uncharacterized protein n=1 Tax=Penicillium paradoxum TaxID=176176 RepID=UPI0025478D03|nr:uncharacterized protein N7457_004052 [Penicillium paradoxum]KAJ5782278.1 hypothetical protein N7457_004052 [Penicillium paradoxum]
MADTQCARQSLHTIDLERVPESTLLGRALSLGSVVTTVSSFALRSHPAHENPKTQTFNQIGEGLQGVIFEQIGQSPVLKKERPGNESLPSNIRHEYKIHQDVSAAFRLYGSLNRSDVHVPYPLEFIPKTASCEFWDDALPRIPARYRTPGDAFKMERILPLPKVTREALVTHFYSGQHRHSASDIENILRNPENKHCLARVYLGKEIGEIPQTESALRNFPLFLNPMLDLGMDVTRLAHAMGKAYAIMHWGAAVNGDDVEFVLGTSTFPMNDPDEALAGLQNRVVGLYLLDFGQCEMVDLTEEPEVVYQAFKGAMVTGDNQLFIPHHHVTPAIFAMFKKGYMEAGKTILTEKGLEEKFSLDDFMRQYEEYVEDFL